MAVDEQSEAAAPAEVAAEGAAKVAAPAIDRTQKRLAALKLTEDGRPATLAELGDERRDLSRNERIKLEKSGLDVWADITERYAKEGFDSITEDDMERFKWYGIYQQRPKNGYFMMRLKVPGGAMNVEQLREVAALSRKFARGISDITTRQDFQMHWLTIESIPEIVERLQNVGLTTRGACGDISRNVCGSPLAGIDPLEVINPMQLVQETNTFFVNDRDYADLPRKHKILIVGRPETGQTEINGLTLYGVKRDDDGAVGYGVRCGGGLSTEPHIAPDLGVFVTPEQALEVIKQLTGLYRDHGYRKNRKHARFKYLVADWGVDRVRAKVEEYLGYKLRDAEDKPKEWVGYQDSLGVHDQVQEGLQWIGVPVVAGRLTSDQIDKIADIAEEFGSGDVRLTVMQNAYIINVPKEKVPGALAALEAIDLPVENTSAVRRGVVACTGIEFCNLAVTETKERARNIVNLLDEGVKWQDSSFFRINVNGCPNSCGQHWIADVGLQGCSKKVDGQLVEHYDVFLGGTLGAAGQGPRFNRRVKRISAEEVAPSIQRAIEHYQAGRTDGESFADFCSRHTEDELQAML